MPSSFELLIAVVVAAIFVPQDSIGCSNSLLSSLTNQPPAITSNLLRLPSLDEYELGASLFLSSDRAGFARPIGAFKQNVSSPKRFIEAQDPKGQTFIFKRLENSDPKEYIYLQALQKNPKIPVPSAYILKLKEGIYLGTKKQRGINIKEVLSIDDWRAKDTKLEIEKMLGITFASEDDSVQAMAIHLLKHPDFLMQIQSIRKAIRSVGLHPIDFQFMFYLNQGQVDIVLIDVELYETLSSDTLPSEYDQDIDFIIKELKRSALKQFYSS